MKTYIKYIIFFIILFLGDLVTGKLLSVLSQKYRADKRIEQLLQNKINADILIIGSSEALNDYSPESITNKTNYSCYNLGISGSNPVFHETILDIVLMNPNKPKLIIYNIDTYASLYKKQGIVYRADILYPYVDNSFINEKICKELKKNNIATKLSSTYRQNVNFVNSLKYLISGEEKIDYRMNKIDAYGATLIESKPTDPPAKVLERTVDLSKLKITEAYQQAIANIQAKCLKNNIKLMFCLPPQLANQAQDFFEIVKQNTNKEVTLVDFSDSVNEPNYFFDSEHLNKEGAKLFSEMLAEEIKKIKL